MSTALDILRATARIALDEYKAYRWRKAFRELEAAARRARAAEPGIKAKLAELDRNLARLEARSAESAARIDDQDDDR